MKNIYKISSILLLTLTIVNSSCKKEEEIPVINGCTDANAMNYLSSANTSDGSCIFAYDIAQGFWDIVTTCEELNISIPFVGDFPVPLNDIFLKILRFQVKDQVLFLWILMERIY